MVQEITESRFDQPVESIQTDPFTAERIGQSINLRNKNEVKLDSVPSALVGADGSIMFSAGDNFTIAQANTNRSARLGFDLPVDPATLVPASRRSGLDAYTDQLIKSVSGDDKLVNKFDRFGLPYNVTETDNKVTYKEYGKLLNNIAQRKDLSEGEKVYVWTKLNGNEGKTYKMSTEGANPNVVDTIMPWDTGHAVLHGGAKDGYHVPMVNMTNDQAINAITENERSEGKKHGPIAGAVRWAAGVVTGTGEINRGDFNASVAQVAALRALKSEGFSGYAREWNARFVKH
jgi:hypothetical protein